jgi:hypothetical protein
VAQVDPQDDTLLRYVVFHYRHDPVRRERRHMLVAAFDDPQEFEAALQALHRELQVAIDTGRADPREHVSGVMWAPGDRARTRAQRQAGRAIRHGVHLGLPPDHDSDDPAPTRAAAALLHGFDPGEGYPDS